MKTIKIVNLVSARPQFVKVAAVSRAIAKFNASHSDVNLEETIVHTGQHYDDNLSKVFFDELEIPEPVLNFGIGSGTHAWQTGEVMKSVETFLQDSQPDWVIVYGDTNGTLAGALATTKLHIPLAHVEAGLRSYNRRVPEEVNRAVADYVSDMLFCPSKDAVQKLVKEGRVDGVYNVGDVMYDTLLHYLPIAQEVSSSDRLRHVQPGEYYLATVHRAENTNNEERLSNIFRALEQLSYPVVIPLHPRTREAMTRYDIVPGDRVVILDPVPYLEMLRLEQSARVIITDSGGVQREAYWLKIPCLTLVDEQTWVELFTHGCNESVGADPDWILAAVTRFEEADLEVDCPPGLYGDGHASDRIVELLVRRE